MVFSKAKESGEDVDFVIYKRLKRDLKNGCHNAYDNRSKTFHLATESSKCYIPT